MSVYAHIVGDVDVRLWGLTSRERLCRQIAAVPGARLIDDLHSVPDDSPIICVRGDYLFEPRTLKMLAERSRSLLRCPEDGRLAAGIGTNRDVPSLRAALAGESVDTDMEIIEPASLGAYEDHLRKAEDPLLLPVSPSRRGELEDRLYGRAYKGITDLVTKWFWPRPAKHAVRICANLGLTPNMVTLTGLALVVYAGFAFHDGAYWQGLAAGWLMTFLDTVDGKLARVTVTSSRFGHLLDHGIDLVHPPVWYVLWGLSLTGPLLGFTLAELCWWVVVGYLVGRVVEGAFHALGECGVFDWRPFDAYFRLVTARRNPCLIILTVGLLADSPDGAFIGVVGWTVATSAVLLVRFAQALFVRISRGPLRSWLADPVSAAARHPRAFRSFSRTRSAYGE